MIARVRFFTRSPWGRTGVLLLTAVLPVYLACTTDPDTEPHVPALQGASQPEGSGALLSEAEACERMLDAATAAYADNDCELADVECPAFIRPAGASGCYEYSEASVEECESSYAAASSCSSLGPCFATAVENTSLPTCQLVSVPGEGGAPSTDGGAPGTDGGAPTGGTPGSMGGTPGSTGGTPSTDGGVPGSSGAAVGGGGAAP